MVELALKRHGHIDALVNNDAFPALRAPLAEARMEDFRSALEAMAVAAASGSPSWWRRRCASASRAASCSCRRRRRCAASPTTRPYVSARAAANGLVVLARQGARPRRHHGERGRLELCREPRLLPAAAARQHRGDGQDDGADPARPPRQERASSAPRSASCAPTARASSPATCCHTPAAGPDHTASRPESHRHGTTKTTACLHFRRFVPDPAPHPCWDDCRIGGMWDDLSPFIERQK